MRDRAETQHSSAIGPVYKVFVTVINIFGLVEIAPSLRKTRIWGLASAKRESEERILFLSVSFSLRINANPDLTSVKPENFCPYKKRPFLNKISNKKKRGKLRREKPCRPVLQPPRGNSRVQGGQTPPLPWMAHPRHPPIPPASQPERWKLSHEQRRLAADGPRPPPTANLSAGISQPLSGI